MKKVIKIMSLLMAMILTVTALSGCSIFMDEVENPEEVTLNMKIGIPVDKNDEAWIDWEDTLEYVKQDVFDFSNIVIDYVKVPQEEGEALDDFMADVASGDIACFFSGPEAFIDELIEDEALKTVKSMQGAYDTILGEAPEVVYDLSQAEDLQNYMIPFFGTYQALFYNRQMLKDRNLPNPTSPENLDQIITAMKAEGITPIAAGFADEGLEYMMDEMILAEGGTAEHSYMPVNGTMSSWERAIDDIRALEAKGAFTKDCYNVSFEDAKAAFLNKEACMIVAPSDSFGGELDESGVKGVPYPTPTTGKRETNAIVGRATFGMYVSKAYFDQQNSRYSAVIVDLLSDDYFGGEKVFNIYKDASNINYKASYYEYLIEKTTLDDSKQALIKDCAAGDYPLRDNALDMDALVTGFREALTCEESEVDAILLKISQAETALQDAAEEERKAEEE